MYLALPRIFLLLFVLLQLLGAQSPDEAIEQRANLEIWKKKILESTAIPSIEAIPLLANCMVKMTKPAIYQIEEKWDVFRVAQASLLAIPGHATYYGDRLNKIHEERKALIFLATKDRSAIPNQSIKSAEFWNVKTEVFQTLRYLPSPETVGVLGNYLTDEWIRPNPDNDDELAEQSLGLHAAEVLSLMPLVNKPTAKVEDPTNPGTFIPDLSEWQQWFEQIKVGKRTFQFEGDPTEYSLTGPAPQEMLKRIERDRKRDEERLAGHRRSSPVSDFVSQALNLSKPSTIIGLLAACSVLAAAVWYFLRGRRVTQ